MEHTPPPFFLRGPAPLVGLAFFASLSLTLLVLDARFGYAESIRSVLALAAYPIQQLARLPVALAEGVAGYFGSQAQLREENAELRARLLASAQGAQRFESAAAEASHLRRLIGAAERIERKSMPAEILYSGRDPYSRKVILDRGTQHGVHAGSPVVDEVGVIGQLTRAHAFVSEVTLLTDKDLAIPVQVLRNGLRAIAFGGGTSGMLELRYMAANADIDSGDRLVTSGLDGTYPPGLPVAIVVRVERDAAYSFARVVAQPSAGIERGRYALVLSGAALLPPYPETAQGKNAKLRRAKRKSADGG
ncbi:MAG: rod shape-determining protein MreC [Proteobacteria bacterium]|nr:rod shape-determining protein MreC [Pseudomonadota bacterium]MDA1117016.1 rod shape-determining protein MreC [Pseudomonadota bacterium]